MMDDGGRRKEMGWLVKGGVREGSARWAGLSYRLVTCAGGG